MPLIYLKRKRVTIIPPPTGGPNTIWWDRAKTNIAIDLTNSNRTMQGTTSTSNWVSGIANGGRTGKFVFEFVRDGINHSVIGFSTTQTLSTTGGYMGGIPNTAGIYWSSSGTVITSPGITQVKTSLATTAAVGDVYAIAVDTVAGNAYVFINGVIQNSGNPIWSGLAGKTIYPAGSLWASNSKFTANFSAANLTRTYAGYSAFDA